MFGIRIKLLDIGSGAGFPGIPLSIVFPSMMSHFLNQNKKRVKFLELIRDTSQYLQIGNKVSVAKIGLKNLPTIRLGQPV